MRLLGDVRLIENEKLAPPTVGTAASALELTKPASLKSASIETTTAIVQESIIGSHHC